MFKERWVDWCKYPDFDESKQNMFDLDQKTLIVPLVICYVGGIKTTMTFKVFW